MDEARGYTDRWQHVADVDLHVHAKKLADRRRAGALPLEARPPLDERVVAEQAWREPPDDALDALAGAEHRFPPGDELELLLTWRDVRVVRGPRRAWTDRPVQHRRGRPLRMGGGEDEGHRNTLGNTQ
jgi:hypothetical protein